FDNDNFNITFALQEREGKLIKAPAIILINGIFGNPLSGVARQLAEVMLNSGYHIIALGNPLGPKNIAQKPRYNIGDFIAEGKAFLHNTNKAVDWLLKENLLQGKVHLTAVSYGSFIGTIIKALDSKQINKSITGMTTLLSPAQQMDTALYNMDDIIIETAHLAKHSDLSLMMKSIRFCYLPLKKKPSKKQLSKLKAIFVYLGFQRWLADQTIVANEMYNLNKIPTNPKLRKRWRRSFSFRDYLKEFAPDLKILISSPKGKLNYWIDQFPHNEIRIFTALDDPLNNGIQHKWKNFPNVISIKKAGHYGLRAFPFFNKFLYTILNINH
ncbi:MAG: hypothetical protein HOJ35_10005, partial [Bdellovibrionales bacterium]|nr:hypothetical protein [Bdellovibrionales bacterium]